jgi:hypothetical protein
LREAFAHFLLAQRARVDRRHREVAIEKMLGNARLAHGTEPERMFTSQQRAGEIPRAHFLRIHKDALALAIPCGDEMMPLVPRDRAGFRAVHQLFIRRYAVAEVEAHVAVLADTQRKSLGGILVLLANDPLQLRHFPRPDPRFESDGTQRSP